MEAVAIEPRVKVDIKVNVIEKKEKEKSNGTAYNVESHPYTRPEFWLDPANQYWLKSTLTETAKEYYDNFLAICRNDMKENLIN